MSNFITFSLIWSSWKQREIWCPSHQIKSWT